MGRKKKNILITGAAGFIGSTLVDYLRRDGQPAETLRLVVAPWDNLKNLPHDLFEIAVCDIRDKKSIVKAMEGIDIVYHLAAKTVKPRGSYEYYQDTNVEGLKNLLEGARKYRITKFIHFSSIAVYGLPAWSGPIEGCDETWEKRYSEPYGHTKYESEKIILEAHKKFGLPYVILRPTTVYGPKDTAGIFQLIQAIQKGIFFFIGTGKNKMDYVYVEDVVRFARLIEKSSITNEDFIVGSGTPITQNDLVKSICKSLGRNIPEIYLTKSLALGLSYLVSMGCRLFGIRPVLFPERVNILTTHCYFNITKAKRILGFWPKYSFQEGSDLTVRWIRSNNYIQ